MSSTGALPAGALVAGRYQIQEPLAGEGSAAVYRAVDTRLDRAVALRALPAAEAGGAQQGKAAARLVHPNVARVLDFGSDTELALEFVVADLGTGGSLAALLAQRGAPPLPLALRMVQEAAAGMAAAHRAGLVHGDLHPGVLWLSRDEGRLHVQVLGLGLNPAGSPPPRATARYAAPERLRRSRELTAATDVFSLGVIAYEVFAGLPADWTQLLLQMARGQAVVAPSLLEARPDLPAHVAHAVRRAMMSDPDSRWPDGGELAAHLIEDVAALPQPAPAAAPVIIATPQPVAAEPQPVVAEAAPAEPALAVAEAEPEPEPIPDTIEDDAVAVLVSAVNTPEAAPAAEQDPSPVAEPAPAPVAEAPAIAAEPEPVPELVAEPPAIVAEPEPVPAPVVAPPVVADAVRPPSAPGRRAKPIALASTDLADTLYIPPALEKPARRDEPAAAPVIAKPVPAAASAEKPAPPPIAPPVAAKVETPPPLAATPIVPAEPVTPEPVVAAVPIIIPQVLKPAATVAETAPAVAPPVVPAPLVAEVPAEPAVDDAAPIPLPERRRRSGLQRLGEPSGGHKRGLLAASIAVVVLVVGGVVAKTLLAGGADSPAQVTQNLASNAAATMGGAASPDQPQAPVADTSAAVTSAPLPADTSLSLEEQRRREEERRRQEEQRRLQQRQQDSLRQVQLAAQTAQPAAPVPQQVALQSAPRPTPTVPAPQLEQRTTAPAPSTPAPTAEPPAPRPAAADPNRVYSAEELDTRPSLANASAFRSAVNRTYPGTLRGSNTWGSAVVSFIVMPDGRVDRSSISVVEASQPAFRSAAQAAISNARFNPARVGGQPVRTQVSMPITWQGGGQDD